MSLLRWAVPVLFAFMTTGSLGAQNIGARRIFSLPPWRVAHKVAPEYPALALQNHIQGVVRFTALIDKDGRVERLTLVSGHPLLAPAARKAARQWVYRPLKTGGAHVQFIAQIDIRFALDERGMPVQDDHIPEGVAFAR
jgi:TonB family protein